MHEIKSSGAIFIVIKSVHIADIETLTGSIKMRLITLRYFVYIYHSQLKPLIFIVLFVLYKRMVTELQF